MIVAWVPASPDLSPRNALAATLIMAAIRAQSPSTIGRVLRHLDARTVDNQINTVDNHIKQGATLRLSRRYPGFFSDAQPHVKSHFVTLEKS